MFRVRETKGAVDVELHNGMECRHERRTLRKPERHEVDPVRQERRTAVDEFTIMSSSVQ